MTAEGRGWELAPAGVKGAACGEAESEEELPIVLAEGPDAVSGESAGEVAGSCPCRLAGECCEEAGGAGTALVGRASGMSDEAALMRPPGVPSADTADMA